MADIFVSEILILALLVFPLLRPFSVFLKKTPAISLLPLFSVMLGGLVVFGQGLYVSLLPVLVFSFLVFISELKRVVRFFSGLTNELYAIASIVFRVFLLVAWGFVLFAIVKFSPENSYLVSHNVKSEEIVLTESFDGDSFGKCFSPVYDEKDATVENQPTVLVMPAFAHSTPGMSTVARYFVQENYPVIQITDVCKARPWYLPRGANAFRTVLQVFFGNDNIEQSSEPEFEQFVNAVLEKYASGKTVFVFSEGVYNNLITEYAMKHPSKIAGVFVYASKNYADTVSQDSKQNWSVKMSAGEGVKFLPEVAVKPICFFVDSEKTNLPGMSELRGDDPLAAILLGSSRNIGRSESIKLAKVFEKWIYVREHYAAE